MKLIAKIGFSALASALMLGMNTSTFADGSRLGVEGSHFGFGQPTTVTNLSATLTPSSTAPSGYSGTGRFIFTYNSSNGNGSLHAGVQLPVDGSTIVDSNGAASATPTLTTSTGTTCKLSVKDIDFIYPSSTGTVTSTTTITEQAEYALSISVAAATSSTPTLTAAIGSCSSVSAPKAGDTVSVSIPVQSSNTGAVVTLTGTLATLVGH